MGASTFGNFLLIFLLIVVVPLAVYYIPRGLQALARLQAEHDMRLVRLREATAHAREAEERALNAELGLGPPVPPDPSLAQVPLMVTRDMRKRLLAKGYSNAQIDQMKPAAAWILLQND